MCICLLNKQILLPISAEMVVQIFMNSTSNNSFRSCPNSTGHVKLDNKTHFKTTILYIIIIYIIYYSYILCNVTFIGISPPAPLKTSYGTHEMSPIFIA